MYRINQLLQQCKLILITLYCNMFSKVFYRYQKLCQWFLLVTIVISILFSGGTNFVGYAQDSPNTIIRPMKSTIRYKENDSDRAKELSPQQSYTKQGKGIVLAYAGEAYAKLEFRKNQKQLTPLVTVGPSDKTTNYFFPCPAVKQGKITVGWSTRKEGYNGCQNNVVAYLPGYGKNKGKIQKTVENYSYRSKNKQLEDGRDNFNGQVKISQIQQDATLIRVESNDIQLVIDVLLGDITVDEGIEPIPVISAKNRYIYDASSGRSTITRSPSNVVNDSSVQKFLDPDGWSPEAQEMLSSFKLPSPIQLSETAKQILELHNQCRAKVSVPPLRWSSEIASFAQEWADRSPSGHRTDRRGYGENMAWGQTINQMVGMWCDEEPKYTENPNSCLNSYGSDKTCLHFSQVVWRKTTEVGCGIGSDSRYGKVLVCNYNPPGNYSGERPF